MLHALSEVLPIVDVSATDARYGMSESPLLGSGSQWELVKMDPFWVVPHTPLYAFGELYGFPFLTSLRKHGDTMTVPPTIYKFRSKYVTTPGHHGKLPGLMEEFAVGGRCEGRDNVVYLFGGRDASRS